jgi:hypothetical protein
MLFWTQLNYFSSANEAWWQPHCTINWRRKFATSGHQRSDWVDCISNICKEHNVFERSITPFIFKLLWLGQQLYFENWVNCFTSRVDGLDHKRYTSDTRWSIAGHKFQVLWWIKHVTECTRYRHLMNTHWYEPFSTLQSSRSSPHNRLMRYTTSDHETGQGQGPPHPHEALDRHGEQAMLFVPTWTSGWRRLRSIHFVSWILNEMNTVSALNTLIETLWRA